MKLLHIGVCEIKPHLVPNEPLIISRTRGQENKYIPNFEDENCVRKARVRRTAGGWGPSMHPSTILKKLTRGPIEDVDIGEGRCPILDG